MAWLSHFVEVKIGQIEVSLSDLFRIFYTLGPDKTIVILSGYDKLGNSHKRNQQKEIERARKYRKQWL